MNSEMFHIVIEKNPGILIVEFYGDWCVPCKILGQTIEEIAKEGSIKGNKLSGFLKINVETTPDIVKELEIQSVPTTLIYKGNVLKERISGNISKSSLIEKILGA
jgi:thioredoxin 1